jgi:hypothetical protein
MEDVFDDGLALVALNEATLIDFATWEMGSHEGFGGRVV